MLLAKPKPKRPAAKQTQNVSVKDLFHFKKLIFSLLCNPAVGFLLAGPKVEYFH